MTDESTTKTVAQTSQGWKIFDVNWIRVEGILGIGALITSFIWFLGMPTGMAIGVGFGLVLVLDVIRSLIFDSSQSDRSDLNRPEFTRH